MKAIAYSKAVKGFTLIEIMIVAAIIGVITLFALPAYRDYVIRARVAEGISFISGHKPNIVSDFAIHGDFNSKRAEKIVGLDPGPKDRFFVRFGDQVNITGYHRLDLAIYFYLPNNKRKSLHLSFLATNDTDYSIRLVCPDLSWSPKHLPPNIECVEKI